MKRAALLLVLAGCSPVDPATPGDRDVAALVPSLPASEDQIVAAGERAIPALAWSLRAKDGERASHAARALGRLHRATGSMDASAKYAEAVEARPEPALLRHAWLFTDTDGRIAKVLATAIAKDVNVTHEVILAGATLTGTELADAMLAFIARTRLEGHNAGRLYAVRYLGRAIRRGRTDLLHYLTLIEGAPELIAGIGEELTLAAGGVTHRNWRGWYLDVARKTRWQWLAEAWTQRLGEPFDPSNRAHVDRIVFSMKEGEELEPAFALLEPLLSRRFGYVCQRDLFLLATPAVNSPALANLRDWWTNNGPYAWYDPRDGRWAINGEARAAGTPVDPRTGVVSEAPK